MAKFGVVLVSHSEYIAKGLKELVDEMNDGSVQVVAAGGADGGSEQRQRRADGLDKREEESEQVQSRFRELLNL